MKSVIPFLYLLLFFRALPQGLAQTPFQVRTPQEYFIGGGLLGLNFGGNALYRHKQGLSEETIASLNHNSINKFDRSATLQYSVSAAHWSDRFLLTSLFLPAALMAGTEFRKDSLVVPVMAIEAILLTAAEVQLVKGLVKRIRPFAYNSRAPLSAKKEADATASFFSGHTALTATTAMYTAAVYTQTHPNRTRDPWIWAGAAALPLTTGYLRYRAGKHFPSDILAGLIIGSLNGLLIPYIHKR